jgi:hypothetical protein
MTGKNSVIMTGKKCQKKKRKRQEYDALICPCGTSSPQTCGEDKVVFFLLYFL